MLRVHVHFDTKPSYTELIAHRPAVNERLFFFFNPLALPCSRENRKAIRRGGIVGIKLAVNHGG